MQYAQSRTIGGKGWVYLAPLNKPIVFVHPSGSAMRGSGRPMFIRLPVAECLWGNARVIVTTTLMQHSITTRGVRRDS